MKDVPGGSKEIEISNISLFPEKEPGTNIPRDRRHITSDINKDVYQDSPMIEKVIPYQDGSGKGKIILNSPIVTPMKQGDRLKQENGQHLSNYQIIVRSQRMILIKI